MIVRIRNRIREKFIRIQIQRNNSDPDGFRSATLKFQTGTITYLKWGKNWTPSLHCSCSDALHIRGGPGRHPRGQEPPDPQPGQDLKALHEYLPNMERNFSLKLTNFQNFVRKTVHLKTALF